MGVMHPHIIIQVWVEGDVQRVKPFSVHRIGAIQGVGSPVVEMKNVVLPKLCLFKIPISIVGTYDHLGKIE